MPVRRTVFHLYMDKDVISDSNYNVPSISEKTRQGPSAEGGVQESCSTATKKGKERGATMKIFELSHMQSEQLTPGMSSEDRPKGGIKGEECLTSTRGRNELNFAQLRPIQIENEQVE